MNATADVTEELAADPLVAELAQILMDEARLVGDLRRVLIEQRTAVGEGGAGAVEGSVQELNRALLTLRVAQKRRKTLALLIAGGEQVTLEGLEGMLAERMTPELRAAVVSVRAAASAVAREVAVNQVVVLRALDVGDAFLRQLVVSELKPEQSCSY